MFSCFYLGNHLLSSSGSPDWSVLAGQSRHFVKVSTSAWIVFFIACAKGIAEGSDWIVVTWRLAFGATAESIKSALYRQSCGEAGGAKNENRQLVAAQCTCLCLHVPFIIFLLHLCSKANQRALVTLEALVFNHKREKMWDLFNLFTSWDV